jgi:hypothetical protein
MDRQQVKSAAAATGGPTHRLPAVLNNSLYNKGKRLDTTIYEIQINVLAENSE